MQRDEPISAHTQAGKSNGAVRLLTFPEGLAEQLAHCASDRVSESMSDATIMPRDTVHRVRSSINDSGAIEILGPIVSVQRIPHDARTALARDDFFGLPEDQRHVGPVKILVADKGDMRVFVEAIPGHIAASCLVERGHAAIVPSELAAYRVETGHDYVVVRAFL
ncbi:hypothetical protein [Luteibacter yeojuensis]|uniref:Uncharacterized protein n=1 Tax=Luteibacter yeojuensis TaxID=345309 RepID=A0A7X5TRH7_9GAMM|nr:hypothetical protein [Luteibacter yeojuensis]NID16532.1 hypothetical protein [Luteibacter yeojuensis]